MGWLRSVRLATGLALFATVVLPPGAATATFPGGNGMFAVEIGSGPYQDQIVILGPDGSFGHYFPYRADEFHGDPHWSPDGSLIAFSLDFHIAVARPDGSGLTRLTDGPNFDRRPRWAPDQTRILYRSIDPSSNSEIFVMRSDGSGQTNLTNHPATDSTAEWAPNGSTVVVWSDRHSTVPYTGDLYVMNPDGSGLSRATHDALPDPSFSYAEQTPFSWSPDSRWIVFSSHRGGQGEIVSVRVRGTGRRNLTRNPANDVQPVWGPDGRIAFASNRGHKTSGCDLCDYDVYLMDAEGGNVTRLTNDPEATVPLLWSPDGTKILFAQFDPTGHSTFYVMNSDGSGAFPLETRDGLNYEPDWQAFPSR
jgi:TolB protein